MSSAAMGTAIIPMNPAEWQSRLPTKDQIEEMTTGQLLDVLKLCGTLSDVILQVAAWAWAKLEASGIDLSEMLDSNPYLFRRIRDIAHERLTVEAAMKFGGNSYVLDHVRKMSREQQERLVKDDKVLFVVADPQHGLTERKLPLTALSREQVKQVIDDRGEIRTPNQQRAYLSPAPTPPERDAPRGRVYIVRGKLRTDGEVPVATVIKALKEKGFLPAECPAT